MSKSDLLELLRKAEHYLQDFRHLVGSESLDKLVDDIENALRIRDEKKETKNNADNQGRQDSSRPSGEHPSGA